MHLWHSRCNLTAPDGRSGARGAAPSPLAATGIGLIAPPSCRAPDLSSAGASDRTVGMRSGGSPPGQLQGQPALATTRAAGLLPNTAAHFCVDRASGVD